MAKTKYLEIETEKKSRRKKYCKNFVSVAKRNNSKAAWKLREPYVHFI